MTRTVLELITDALEELGVVGADGVVDDENSAYGLRTLKRMYDAMLAERLNLYKATRTTFTFTASQQAYTMGSGGDFAAERPLWITDTKVMAVGETVEIPVDLYDRAQWADIRDKTQTDSYPRVVNFETTSAVLATFSFWPIPTTAATFVFTRPMALGDPSTLEMATSLAFPEGYHEAWTYQLARRMARHFLGACPADLKEDARAALALVHRMNDGGPPPSTADPAILGSANRGGYNIRTGGYTS